MYGGRYRPISQKLDRSIKPVDAIVVYLGCLSGQRKTFHQNRVWDPSFLTRGAESSQADNLTFESHSTTHCDVVLVETSDTQRAVQFSPRFLSDTLSPSHTCLARGRTTPIATRDTSSTPGTHDPRPTTQSYQSSAARNPFSPRYIIKGPHDRPRDGG